MLLSDSKFFSLLLDESIPELLGLRENYEKNGLASAEKQLADYVRGALRPSDYFKIPYYERENLWALKEDDDFAAAEKILRGELMSVGVPYNFGSPKSVDWEFNPTYNGYIEWTVQLSRHHEWRCLGKCYRETGDEKYAEAFVDYLMSWCEQAVCPENAHSHATKCWRTIEAGIRMIKNWHYAFHAFINSPSLTDHVIVTYLKSVWEHGYRLRGFHASGNWLITEMSGLAHIGMLYPFLNDSAEWANYAFDLLAKEIDVQVYPDGFQYELTTGYHNVVVQNYHWVLCTAEAIGYRVPDALAHNLERMFELNVKITCPDGRFPDLNDGSRAALRFWCQMGSKYFPNNEVIRYFATDGAKGRLPSYTSIALPYAGHAYMRTGWGKNDFWCFMDAGPFGKAHQHEDKLNVLMFAYGKFVLNDSGNYAYDNSPMRKFVLSSYSHNVGLVDDLGQNRRKKYNWSAEMIKERSGLKWGFTKDTDTVEGEYDEGYGAEFIPVTHKRRLIFFKNGIKGSLPCAVVIDRYLSGDGAEHKYATSYQMDVHPFTVDKARFTAELGDGVSMSVIGTAEPEVIIAQKTPVFLGWRKRGGADSEDFEHYHAPCLQYISHGKECRTVTVLYPSNNGQIAIEKVEASSDINSTEIILTIFGSAVKIDENDYKAEDTNEALLS